MIENGDYWELMLEYFEPLTLSLYKEDLYPLACQLGASILIHQAEKRIDPNAGFCYDDEIEPGTELAFYFDFIHDYFHDYKFQPIPRNLQYIECFPARDYQKRIEEAFQELIIGGFIDSVKKLPNGNFEFEITNKLSRHQIIPYAIFNIQRGLDVRTAS